MKIQQLTFTSNPVGKGVEDRGGLGIRGRSVGPDSPLHEPMHREAQVGDNTRTVSFWVAHDDPATCPNRVVYRPLGDDVFVFTHSHYLGADTHSDRRSGNFFSHSLAFEADDLAPFHYNPLALPRTPLIMTEDDDSDPQMPELDSFAGLDAAPDTDWRRATDEPYAEHLEDILSAVTRVPQTRRAAVLVLRDLSMALPIIQTVLYALPPETRCRTSFSSLCMDVKARAERADRSEEPPQLQLIATAFSKEERNSTLECLPNDYRVGWTIFNFADNEFSPLDPPTAWASFVVPKLVENGPEALDPVYAELSTLGLGRDPAGWDAIIPWLRLIESQPGTADADLVQAGVAALRELADTPGQTLHALESLWPHITAARADAALFSALVGHMHELARQLDDDRAAQWYARNELVTLAADLIAGQRASQARGLLPTADEAARPVAAAVLRVLISRDALPGGVPVSSEQWPAVSEQLRLGLSGLADAGAETREFAEAIAACCETAVRAADIEAFWADVRPLVEEHILDESPTDAAVQGVEAIAAAIPADEFPDPSLQLNLWRLRHQPPSEAGAAADELVAQARRAHEIGSEALMQECVELVAAIIPESLQLRARMRMVDALGASAAGDHPYYRAYIDHLQEGSLLGDRLRRAAGMQLGSLVGVELFDGARAENEQLYTCARDWVQDSLPTINGHEGTLVALTDFVAGRLSAPDHRERAYSLVEPLASRLEGVEGEQYRDARTRLARAVVNEPLTLIWREWEDLLKQVDDGGWSAEEQRRRQLILLMIGAKRALRSRLGHVGSTTWRDHVDAVTPDERREVGAWLISEGLGPRYASTPFFTAREVCRMYLSGDPDGASQLAESLTTQLIDECVVRQVTILAPFIIVGAGSDQYREAMAGVLAEPLGKLSRGAERELRAHLLSLTGAPPDWEARLDDFLRMVRHGGRSASDSGSDSGSGGIVDGLRGLLRPGR